MADSLFFNGKQYFTPTAVSAVNDAAEAPSNLTVGNTLAYLGLCTGGQPGKVYTFNDPSQIAPALGSGPLVNAAIKAFAPSTETDAPNKVVCVPVGEAMPGTATLKDSRGDPSLVVTSVLYGTAGNLPTIGIEAGAAADQVMVEVAAGQSYFTSGSLGGDLFSVLYIGADTLTELVINSLASTITFSAQAGNNPVQQTLPITPETVVQDIVNFLNSIPGVTAAVLNGNGQHSMAGMKTIQGLALTAQAQNFSANLDAVLAWLNGPAQGLMTAAAAAPTSSFLLAPALVGPVYLSGGTAPTATVQDWVNAFTALQAVDCQWVVPLTADEAIWAAGDAHVQYMSTVGQKERRQLVGPAAGTSLAAVSAMPLLLNSDRTAICWPGYYDFNAAGDLVLFDPFYTAAVAAAGFAGAPPGTPMTNISFTFRGMELPVKNPLDTDLLIQAGVMPFDQEPTGYMCVRSISTWLVNNNYNRVEVSTGAATDYMVRTVRTALAALKGKRGDPLILGRAIAIATTALTTLAVPPPLGPGVIVGDANSPAFYGVKAALQGDILSVSWNASPVVPVNFIPCSVSISPYSGSLTSVGAASAVNTIAA